MEDLTGDFGQLGCLLVLISLLRNNLFIFYLNLIVFAISLSIDVLVQQIEHADLGWLYSVVVLHAFHYPSRDGTERCEDSRSNQVSFG